VLWTVCRGGGPLTGQIVSWKFIALVGLIGGGSTFLGTVVGIIFQSPQVFILFLALAAGAILYVVAELLGGETVQSPRDHDVGTAHRFLAWLCY
jgi:zinc transporter ZupT